MKLETPNQTESNLEPNYFVWEQHNVTIIRSANYGYGIAISGGLCDTNQDASIYVSDIVSDGPAKGKLAINDKILSVNGVNIENVEHSFVIRLLKEAKEFIHLVIKRKINNNYSRTKETMLKKETNDLLNGTSTIKRCNQAIMHTANTILANFNNNEYVPTNVDEKNSTVPLLKPIKVTINKKDKKDTFGIVLGCKYYIKEIVPESIAAHETCNLRKGDVLLKLNELSSDQLSLREAKKLILKSNKLSLTVKRNSLTSDDDNEEEIHQTETPPPLPATDQIDSTTLKQPCLNKQLFKPIKAQNDPSTNTNSNSQFFSNKSTVLNYRTIRFARENGIGIRLAGGNKVGIFICDVQYNSPAERAGLKIADKIIKVNDTDYLSLTREQAVHHILMIQNTIEMVVALARDEYEQYAFDPLGGDSFYIRAHFNYSSQNNVDLSFNINDILHVTDTLYNGVMGQWVATKLTDTSSEQHQQLRGTIPNQTSAEQLVLTAKTIDELIDSSSSSSAINNLQSIGASARMSIRKKLGKSGALAAAAKRSKSASRSAPNSDNESDPQPLKQPTQSKLKVSKANTFCGSKYPAYERVVLKEVNFTRPIVIFGPLADIAREKLKEDFPNKFSIPDSYSTDSDPSSAGVIKLANIKSIIDLNQHCLLDITPNAVEHLNYAQYFPVCVYLAAQSAGHVKELRHKLAKHLKPKSCKRLQENATRLSTYYSHLFTSKINLDSSQWYKKLKETIDSQQKQPLWISQELDDLLTQQQPQHPQQQQQQQLSPNNFDMSIQQQNFIAKQNLLIKQQQQQQLGKTRYDIFDDNFELPMYNGSHGQHFSVISGAASTYSLYEDQNYRSSFAASDTDICMSSNPVASSSIIKTANHNEPQPIYSSNFNTSRLVHQDINKSDSNLINYEAAASSTTTTHKPESNHARNALIQKTKPEQHQQQHNYRRLSTNSDYMSMNTQQQAPSYKLIKNSQSSLNPISVDNSLHYTDLNEQAQQSNNASLSLLQTSSHIDSPNELSLVEKLNKLKMADSSKPKQSQAPIKPPPPTLPKPKFNLPQSSVTNLVLQRNLKAKSELNIATPASYSSPSSSSASSTCSSKDVLNSTNSPLENEMKTSIKQPINVQHIIPVGSVKQARNKFIENHQINNNSISSSQGYQSDTWESHSSRQSFDILQQPQQHPPAPFRYKHFNKNSKLAESKLAKTANLPLNSSVKHITATPATSDTAGSTSDGSLNCISGDDTDSIPIALEKVNNSSSASTTSNSSASCSSSSTSSAAAISAATTLSSTSSNSFSAAVQSVIQQSKEKSPSKRSQQGAIELPIYYQTNNPQTVPPAITTYTAHYNDNGIYRKLSLDSNSNCSIIASANGIFDFNGGILESADTGVSINVPEGAIANGYSFDLYFKVCHCKSNITNGKGELLTNPIVMCGPRGVKFLKPIELQIPHFISIDGQSWSYAFKTCDLDDSFNFSRFQKKTLLNSVIVTIDGF